MPILLRKYQKEAIDAVRAFDRAGKYRSIINLPTGTGKTCVAMTMVASALSRGHRVLWLAHRMELVDQAIDTFRALAPEHAAKIGVVKADRDEHHRDFVVASCQTLWQEKRLAAVMQGKPFVLVVWDEVHHAASTSNARIMAALPADACVVGLTATVERGDSVSLRSVFPDGIAYQLPLMTAIRDGYLVPFVPCPVRIDALNLDDIGDVAGDYNQGELGAEMERDIVTDAVASAIIEHASDRHSIVFTVTVRQAQDIVGKLNSHGLCADVIHADTPADERRGMLRLFREGTIKTLCSCAVLTEGFDAPIADCVVVARPTRAKCLYIQQLGRGLRLYPQTGKRDCLVIDLMGATVRHSPYQAAALLEDALAPACTEPNCGHSMIEHEDDDADASLLACAHPMCECRVTRKDRCGKCKHPNDHHVVIAEDDETFTKRCRDTKINGEPCECKKEVPKPRMRDDWEARTWAQWVRMEEEDAYVASGPNRVCVIVYPDKPRTSPAYDPNKRRVVAWTARGRIDLTPEPVWEEMAIGIGEDAIRRAGGKNLSKKTAEWRMKSASEKQINALAKWHVRTTDEDTGEPLLFTAGEAGDLMTEAIGRARLRDVRRGKGNVIAFANTAELDDALLPPVADDVAPF